MGSRGIKAIVATVGVLTLGDGSAPAARMSVIWIGTKQATSQVPNGPGFPPFYR
jgi:hypothetical protein